MAKIIRTVKDVQYNATRPTSATIMLVLFQLLQLVLPVSQPVQEGIYTAITIVGTSGLIEKAWKNRKQIKEWVKSLFKRK